jgi:hypothetical protein
LNNDRYFALRDRSFSSGGSTNRRMLRQDFVHALETYTTAIVQNFRATEIDYGTIDKDYRSTSDERRADRRYSPGALVSTKKRVVIGEPDESKICTSYIERMNLSIHDEPPFYAAHERVFQARRDAPAFARDDVLCLQPHQEASVTRRKDSGDGSGDHGPRVHGAGHDLRGGSRTSGSRVADSKISRRSFAYRLTKKYLVRY